MFSKLNFIIPLTNADKLLRIRNINGLVVHIIKDPTCTVKQEGVNITIKQQSESNSILLTFSNIEEATDSHIILRDNLKILSNNLGINIVPTPSPTPINCSNNCEPNRTPVILTDIWTESNLIPYTAPLNNTSVIQIINDLQLSHIPNTYKFTDINFTDIIPHYFGDGSSYAFIIKTYNDVIIPTGWQNWYVDLTCGIICFNNGFVSSGSIIVDETHPPKISFYKYIGNKGVLNSNNNLTYSFYPTPSDGINNLNIILPIAIQSIICFYLNGQLIDNNIIPQYILNPSITAPTTITWKHDATYLLESDDIVTLIYN